MNYIDFFRDALKLGLTLGVGPGSTAQTIESAWGSEFIEDVHKRGRMKRRDYGLAEFSFRKDVEWICTGFIIQAHRLATHGNSIVPAAVSSIYGEFPKAVSFNALADALQGSGVRLEEEESPGSGFDTYAVPGTSNHLYATKGSADSAHEGHNHGEVWSISVQKLNI